MSVESKLADALGSAAGWKRLADKNDHAKKVAQAHSRFMEEVIADARAEIVKPFLGDESLTERMRKVAAILDRRPPVIRISRRDEKVSS